MPRFRAFEIEAIQIHDNASDLWEFLGDDLGDEAFFISVNPIVLAIDSRHGRTMAYHGDWVIRGFQGELSICRPDLFATTYEEIA